MYKNGEMKVTKNGAQKSRLPPELINSVCEVENSIYPIPSNSFRNNS
jgi:hypothetical protein